MKKTLLFLGLLLLSVSDGICCEWPSGHQPCPGKSLWPSTDAYFTAADAGGFPKVLIIGCGHLDKSAAEGDHSHEKHYCTNITDPDAFDPYPKKDKKYGEDNPYWKAVGADQCMDITTPYVQGRPLFDVVVLERNWNKTLNNASTLYNAASWLKVGGELIVDVHDTYNYPLYGSSHKSTADNLDVFLHYAMPKTLRAPTDRDEAFDVYSARAAAARKKGLTVLLRDELDLLFQLILNQDMQSKSPRLMKVDDLKVVADKADCPFDADALKVELSKFSLADKFTVEHKLFPMGEYLSNWGFVSVLPLKNATQPYCGREGSLLVATKTQFSQDMAKEWRDLVMKWQNGRVKPAEKNPDPYWSFRFVWD